MRKEPLAGKQAEAHYGRLQQQKRFAESLRLNALLKPNAAARLIADEETCGIEVLFLLITYLQEAEKDC